MYLTTGSVITNILIIADAPKRDGGVYGHPLDPQARTVLLVVFPMDTVFQILFARMVAKFMKHHGAEPQ